MPAVPGARRSIVVGLVPGHLGLGSLVGLPRLAAQPIHRGRRIRLRDLEMTAVARLARAQHTGEQAERTEQRAGV